MKKRKQQLKEMKKTMTPAAILFRAEKDGCHTIEIQEAETKKVGVANSCENGIAVFYGAEDGSDDTIISADEFNQRFTITAIIDS